MSLKSIKKYKSVSCVTLLLWATFTLSAQDPVLNTKTDSSQIDIPPNLQSDVPVIALEEVVVFGRRKFSSYEEKKRYLILRRKVRKVYPYAILAAKRLTELEKRLSQIKTKKDKKKYVRIVQRYFEHEFSHKIKNMTRTEGQILIKLIHRQTGRTVFHLLKELRSGWNAFWHNATAWTFNLSLKREYHPESTKEDVLIEEILQRDFSTGQLQKMKSPLGFDYFQLTKKQGKAPSKMRSIPK